MILAQPVKHHIVGEHRRRLRALTFHFLPVQQRLQVVLVSAKKTKQKKQTNKNNKKQQKTPSAYVCSCVMEIAYVYFTCLCGVCARTWWCVRAWVRVCMHDYHIASIKTLTPFEK